MKAAIVRTILVPVDESNNSLKAAKYAMNLAQIMNSKIILLHAIKVSVPYGKKYRRVMNGTHYEEIKNKANELLSKIMKLARNQNLIVEKDVVVDYCPIKEIIIKYSKRRNVDLIIMSPRRKGLSRLLLGSITQAVINGVTCPVLIVK